VLTRKRTLDLAHIPSLKQGESLSDRECPRRILELPFPVLTLLELQVRPEVGREGCKGELDVRAAYVGGMEARYP
jgi:hypothetical protein